ncbi:MAG: transcription elongation factor GreA [Chloroflexota bacterium]
MPDDRSAAALLREVGLLPDGPAFWGKPARHNGPGVFLIELNAPVPTLSVDLAVVGRWIEHVPDLRLDGKRPGGKEIHARLAESWLPSQQVLFIGSSAKSVAGRVAALYKTVPGDSKPAGSGLLLHLLRNPGDLRVWWAATDAVEEYEDALMDAFASGIPAAEKASARDGAAGLPWAMWRSLSGARKDTGIAPMLLPEVKAPAPPPVTRIVTLPTAEADGARDEAKRGRRPAPGRGEGRIASAAAYAAQGSPRKVVEPVLVSPEGLERMQAELAELIAQRPDVVKRIATAREHGDLKENAEYHAAREEQGFLEGRINALQAKLKVAKVVAPTERGAKVELGSRVTAEVDGEEERFSIVGPAEANIREGRMSSASPVGAALMGKRVGDLIEVITPGGRIAYKILEID